MEVADINLEIGTNFNTGLLIFGQKTLNSSSYHHCYDEELKPMEGSLQKTGADGRRSS